MTTTGDIAKGLLIFCCGYFLFMAIVQVAAGQTAMAAFMLFGFAVPLTTLIHSRFRRKKEET